jgi:hypothetical protein
MDRPSRKQPRTGGEDDHTLASKKVRLRPASGFYGVCAQGKRWRAKIYYCGNHHNLGTFDTQQQAALAYDRAAREHGGGTANVNYESIEVAEEAAAQAQVEHTLLHGTGADPKHRPPSGFHGVRAQDQRRRQEALPRYLRWQAHFNYGGKKHYLGTFDTKQEAALAYDRAAREHGRGTAKVNYESIEVAEEAAAQAEAEHTKSRPPSGFHGVQAQRKRWQAQIRYGGKHHYIGIFDTKQEAALAYDRAAREHGGGKKQLNYASIEAAEEAAVQAQAEHILVHDMCAGPKPRPASGFYGVYARGKRWVAQINYGGKVHFLGTFDTKQEAALAYDRQARQCGNDKPLNYESIAAAEEAAVQAQAEYKTGHA